MKSYHRLWEVLRRKALLALFVVTFLVLGYIGTQPAYPVLSELGLRFAELYFGFFVLLWAYSRDRSTGVVWTTLFVVLAVIGIVDWIRFDPNKSALMMGSVLIPVVYFVGFLVLPMLTRLNESRPVPERLTAK